MTTGPGMEMNTIPAPSVSYSVHDGCSSPSTKGLHGPGKANRLDPWSSLVEEDEQPDQPNSQTTMEFCHSCLT